MNLVEVVLAMFVLTIALTVGWNADVTALYSFARANALQTAAMVGESALQHAQSELAKYGKVASWSDLGNPTTETRVQTQELALGLWGVTVTVYQKQHIEQPQVVLQTVQAVSIS